MVETATANICADTLNNPCPVNNKKPVEVCNELKKTYSFLEDIVKAVGDFSPVGVIKAIGSSNKATTNQKTICNNIINSTNISESIQNCNNIVNSSQTNVISQPEGCAEMQNKIIASLKDNPTSLKIYLESLNVENVTQSNESNDLQQCTLSSYMSALNKQEASIDNAAIALLLQRSSDLLSSNEITQNQCQNLNNELTACNYLKSIACCSNSVSNEQSNSLYKCNGAVKNIVQKNLKNNYQFCNMSNTSTLSNEELAALLNKSTMDTTQVSVGTSALSFLLFFLIVVGLPIVAGGVVAKMFNNIIPFLGFIPIFVGAVLLIYYFFISSPSQINSTVKDKPLISSKKITSNNYSGNSDISYNDAYNNCEKDDKCVAVDFIYDKTDPKTDTTISKGSPYNIKGSSIYYSSINGISNEDPPKFNDNPKEKKKGEQKSYYTFYKKENPKTPLYVGIFSIVLGILYSIALFIYHLNKKRNLQKDITRI